jgi:hypothetical protein
MPWGIRILGVKDPVCVHVDDDGRGDRRRARSLLGEGLAHRGSRDGQAERERQGEREGSIER